MTHLLPRRLTAAVQIQRQDRVLTARPEVPGRLPSAVAVQVHGPASVETRVAGRPLQRRRRPTLAVPPAGETGDPRVPVAGDYVAAGNRRDGPDQAADIARAGNRPGRIARFHRAPGQESDQAADEVVPRHAPRRVAAGDETEVHPDQTANQIFACPHRNSCQPDAADAAGRSGLAEQAGAVHGVDVDEQVGDGPPVAVEGRGERSAVCTDGLPADAAVPVRVARVGTTAAVGVEVEVRGQLVPGTTVDAHAAQPVDGIGERGAIRGRPAGRHAVPVEIAAHRVELRQRIDLDESVVVGVVVDRRRRPHRDGETLHRARIRAGGVGRRHRDRRRAFAGRRDRHLRARHAHGRHARRRRGRRVVQHVVLGVEERARDVHDHGVPAHAQRPVRQPAHRHRGLIADAGHHRQHRAARRLAVLDHRGHLVVVRRPDGHVGIGVL